MGPSWLQVGRVSLACKRWPSEIPLLYLQAGQGTFKALHRHAWQGHWGVWLVLEHQCCCHRPLLDLQAG